MRPSFRKFAWGTLFIVLAATVATQCSADKSSPMDELARCSHATIPESARLLDYREEQGFGDSAIEGLVSIPKDDIDTYKSQFGPNAFQPGVPDSWSFYWHDIEGSDELGNDNGKEHAGGFAGSDSRHVVIYDDGTDERRVFISAGC